MHPRQPSPSCLPTPSPTFGSRHSGQHFSHPKICFAHLLWHRVLLVCVSQGSWQPTLGACRHQLIKSPGYSESPAVNVCIHSPRLRM